MTRTHIFADESGDLGFTNVGEERGGSIYFNITTVSCDDYALGDALTNLRRDLIWRGADIGAQFHATNDKQAIRNQVFEVLTQHEFRVDVSIFDKRRVIDRLADDQARFYKTAWFNHAKHVMPLVTQGHDELFVLVASLNIGKQKKETLHRELVDVMGQCAHNVRCEVGVVPASSEPCIQVADYCSWAIHRKWERGDSRSYDLIKSKIRTEFPFFTRSVLRRGKEERPS